MLPMLRLLIAVIPADEDAQCSGRPCCFRPIVAQKWNNNNNKMWFIFSMKASAETELLAIK